MQRPAALKVRQAFLWAFVRGGAFVPDTGRKRAKGAICLVILRMRLSGKRFILTSADLNKTAALGGALLAVFAGGHMLKSIFYL
jgi:hypothetical protein